ncbi:adenosine deaminase [Clostridium bovifaecis]|uniref:Adenosine deaminase n=1 Tax=Clostridium bovifaecis TaxID=2184719 RepID=A0A6I6F2N7_9CLOT|nr:adenosine deaminase [Clostridium bovifaecis]
MRFDNLPKIELHCHLDGSVRPETIIDISTKDNINIPSNDINIIRNMLIAPWECESLDEYLERFKLPLKVMQTKDNIRRIAFELLEDASKENVKYIEVRFAPLLHREKGLSIEGIIESVLEGIKDAENRYDIEGNLILSCLKHMPVETAVEVIEKGKKFLGKGVVAVDLAASEDEGFSQRFVEPIALARKYGYRITIHAGETGTGRNVLEAVEVLGAERIGHGVYITNCLEAYNIVKEKNITLEICPTSNVQTKAVNRYESHPVYDFYKDGIKVTINTDNRTVSDTTMTKEYNILSDKFNLSYEEYKQTYYNAIEASFANKEVKERLKRYI